MKIPKEEWAMNEVCLKCQKTVVLPLDFGASVFRCPECGATYPLPEKWQADLDGLHVLAAQHSAQSQS